MRIYVVYIIFFCCNCSDYVYFVTQKNLSSIALLKKKKSELVLNSCSHVFGIKLKAKCCAIK